MRLSPEGAEAVLRLLDMEAMADKVEEQLGGHGELTSPCYTRFEEAVHEAVETVLTTFNFMMTS